MTTKKKILIIAIIVFTLLIIAIIFIINSYKPLYYRFYIGDRVTGTVEITVNNSPANIKEKSVKCIDGNNSREKSSYDFEVGKMKISTRANDYDMYTYTFSLDELPDKQCQFTVWQFNWWNVTDFKYSINIDTVSRVIKCNCEYTDLSEEGETTSHNESEVYSIDEYDFGTINS